MIGETIKTERTQKFNSFGKFYARCVDFGLDVSPSTLSNWEKGQKLPAHYAPCVADALSIELDDLLRTPEWRAPTLPGLDTAQQDPQLAGATP